MLRRTGRRVPARPGIPKSDEEEGAGLPYPGHNWDVERVDPPYEYRGLEVDWTPTDKKIGSIFLPDGEELEVWSDPIPFGFARALYED